MSHLTTHELEDVLRKTAGAPETFQYTSILPFDPTRCLKISKLKNGLVESHQIVENKGDIAKNQ